MAFTIYRYVLTDHEGNALGELTGATGRSLQRKLNGIDTASVAVSLADPVARYLLRTRNEAGQPADELRLQVFRDDGTRSPRLVFYGPVVDVETIFGPTSGVAQINAASPLWYLTHRFAFKAVNAQGLPLKVNRIDVGRAQLVRDALVDISNESALPFFIAPGTPDTGTVGSAAQPFDASWRNVAELMAEMSAGQLNNSGSGGDGFDFFIEPEEGGGKMGALYLVGRRGVRRPSVIFETGIGTRNNAVEARQAFTRSGLANWVYHVPEVYSAEDLANNPPDNPLPVVSQNRTPSIQFRGRHEAILRDDIQDLTFRNALVDLHSYVRQNPRRIVTFQPAPEEQGDMVPRAIADYDIGDTIFLRVVAPSGAIAINDELRVYGIDTEIDDQTGTGRHTLTLTPEE